MQAPLPFSDRVDMKTMCNNTWTSLAGTGLPAAEKFSVPKVGEFSELVGQGKGKVGNRVGESALSYKTSFKKNEQRTMKNGKPFESRCTQPSFFFRRHWIPLHIETSRKTSTSRSKLARTDTPFSCLRSTVRADAVGLRHRRRRPRPLRGRPARSEQDAMAGANVEVGPTCERGEGDDGEAGVAAERLDERPDAGAHPSFSQFCRAVSLSFSFLRS